MTLTTLNAISPIDGRYSGKTRALNDYFSEYALISYRTMVEIKWFESLSKNSHIKEVPNLDKKSQNFLNKILQDFNEEEAAKVKEYEKQVNHDVKAVEYYLRDKFQEVNSLNELNSFIHFALTSEDVNNIAYALMTKETITNIIVPSLAQLTASITLLGKQHGNIPMLARTHGQPATPTTIGKELINFASRLKRPQQQLVAVFISAKCNGAVGNYNAHVVAYPEVDWRKHAQSFIQNMGLSFNAYTTQIEPHDTIAEVSHLMIRINNILLDYAQDIWNYISLGYFKQKNVRGEVGSSTMPHKINPIDFENAEGNIGLANALFAHFANKLTKSRLQRDLSDSTVLRNLGAAFAYTLIAWQSIIKGNEKLEINENALQADLENKWELLAEAIQTTMRRYKIPNAYEKLCELTRGQGITRDSMRTFINSLEIPENAKKDLLNLTPEKYTGLASVLVKVFS